MTRRRRYSLVTRALWSDARYLGLSGPEPNAQTLWIYLLTGPVQGPIPGLFAAGVGTLSDGLGWSSEATAEALQELEQAGMVRVSSRPPLLWLPRAVVHNPPANPNVIKSWRSAYLELPETDLRDEAMAGIRAALREGLHRAFDSTFPGLRNRSCNGIGNGIGNRSGKGKGKGSGKGSGGGVAGGVAGGVQTPVPAAKQGRRTTANGIGNRSGNGYRNGYPNQDHRSKKVLIEGRTSEEAALRLAQDLREAIRSHTPRVAQRYDPEGKLQGWARDLERLLRIDRASEAEVRSVIRWAHQQDSSGFWRGNLLSGGKVRQHFDRLLIQARQGGAAISSGATDPTREWMSEHHPWLLRWRDELRALGSPPSKPALLQRCATDGVPVPDEPGRVLAWLETR